MALAAHLPTECKFPQVFSTRPFCESKAGHFHLMHVANEDGIGSAALLCLVSAILTKDSNLSN